MFKTRLRTRPGAHTRFESPAAVPEEAEVVVGALWIAFRNPYPMGSRIMFRAGAGGTGAGVGIYSVQGPLVRTFKGSVEIDPRSPHLRENGSIPGG